MDQAGAPTSRKVSQQNQVNKQVKRTKGHEALLKIKEVESHLDMMRRRNKYLQVRDELNRSLTIQHEKKLMQHEERRLHAKNDKQQLDRHQRIKMYELESTKERNTSLRDEREKNIAQSLEKCYNEKVESYRTSKVEKGKNEECIIKHREWEKREKEERRRSVHEMEETSRNNIGRYRQNKYKDALQFQSREFDSLMSLAASKQRELDRLSKIEVEMVKKHSESMQSSQLMKNKLRQVFGQERRLLRLPEIKPSSVTRGSTSNTQILIL